MLDDVDLDLASGQAALVSGPSGCGKTTLLNLAGGLDRPDAGTLEVGGTAIHRLSEGARARWRAQNVGFVFQHHFLPPGATARECVAGPLMWGLGEAPREALERADAWLERVGLADHRRRRVQRLSGGQRQRVAFARALVHEPPLLLADEPTAQLDSATGRRMEELLHEAVEQRGAALLIVSHETQPGEWAAAQRLRLEAGKLMREDA